MAPKRRRDSGAESGAASQQAKKKRPRGGLSDARWERLGAEGRGTC